MTVWKRIPGCPRHEASDTGQIRTVEGRVLVQQLKRDGYLHVALYWDKQLHYRSVNRVIARTFHGEPPFPKAEAAHDDGVRINNRADNISWKTSKANHADRKKHGTDPVGSRQGQAVLNETTVLKIRQQLRKGARNVDLQNLYGVCSATISQIKTRTSWRHI